MRTTALILLLLSVSLVAQNRPSRAPAAFTVVEASIADMQSAMKDGRATSRSIVTEYLTRIATFEDTLHAAQIPLKREDQGEENRDDDQREDRKSIARGRLVVTGDRPDDDRCRDRPH